MMRPLMWLGLICWAFCVFDWLVALLRAPRGKRTVRGIVVLMGCGWVVLLARELQLLPRLSAQAIVLAGVVAGVFSGTVLLFRWVRDPRILD